jgi:hypothetical protein
MEKVIKVPDSWEEVTIETLQELNNANNVHEKIAIIIDQDPEDIRKYDTATIARLSNALGWIHEMPKEDSLKNVIEIDGIEYGLLDKFSDLLYGEWMDIEEYCKEPIENIHKLMAMFYRPLLTTLKDGTRILDEYNVKEAHERAETFRKKMKVSECYGALVFFSLIEKRCLVTIQAYFQVEIIKMQAMKERQKQKERLESQKRKGLLSGVGGHLRTLLQKGTSSK